MQNSTGLHLLEEAHPHQRKIDEGSQMENQNRGGVTLCYYDYLARHGITAHRTTILKWEKLARFPLRVRLGGNRVAWIQSEIDEYLQSLAAMREAGK